MSFIQIYEVSVIGSSLNVEPGSIYAIYNAQEVYKSLSIE